MTPLARARTLGIRRGFLVVALLASLFAGTAFWRRTTVDTTLVAPVQKGALTAQLTTTGILRPSQSITYRSPLAGREAEIIELVPEGTRVNEGDLILRLDTTDLRRDVERGRQDVRQSELDLQVADIERQESQAALKAVSEGEGALSVEEIRARRQLAERKVIRLRQEYAQLEPLMAKGFITREELKKTSDELEQSEDELALTKRRADVVVELSHPRDEQRAVLQVAQKTAQYENAKAKAREARARLELLVDQVENCSVYARRPGMAVFEELLSANPRRKIRIGDRVTGSQGLVTIPEVDRMLLEASVGEAEVHRVRHGQTAAVRVEAFPDLRLTGTVTRIGTLARSSADRPFEDKRFDLIVDLDPVPAELRPEMTARADILVGTRADVLLVPVNAIFEEQGRYVAHVLSRFGVETRPVEIGEASDVVVEVVTGLHEGEQVMLTDPGKDAGSRGGAAPMPVRSIMRGAAGNALQPR
jgi:HlyD family secretion protein